MKRERGKGKKKKVCGSRGGLRVDSLIERGSFKRRWKWSGEE